MKTEAPEKKSAKTLKGQLFGAVSMMLVAAIALGTSTYAWFISNQAVKVDTMELSVSTATSLLAAVGRPASVAKYSTPFDSTKYTNFKTMIIASDINGAEDSTHGGWTNFFNGKMVPSSVTSAALGLAGTADKFPNFYKSIDKYTDSKVSNFVVLPHDSVPADDVTGLGQGAVKHLRLAFMGSSSNLNVYLGAAGTTEGTNTIKLEDLVTTSKSGVMVNNISLADQAKYIRSALRVAIVPVSPDSTPATPAVFQFDDGAAAFGTHSGNNTYYNNITSTVTADEANGIYSAIAEVDTNGLITKDGALNATRPTVAGTPAYTNPYIATVDTTNGAFAVSGATKELFKLEPNKEQIVDIYIWLEGTDKDCVNDLAQFYFGLNLPFVAAVDTTTP